MSLHYLVTGGAGYIGSHTLIEMLQAGYTPVVLDNFSNSSNKVFDRLKTITGTGIKVIHGDIRDRKLLDDIFAEHDALNTPIQGVIHFAALKAVGDSVKRPLEYYENNVAGTVTLLQAMLAAGVNRIVFSSSATVYGEPEFLPYTESHRIGATNPYGWTKVQVEQILKDTCVAHQEFSAIALRYFNPIGAHESGLIGENPRDIPNNLFPFITQVAVGRLEKLNVFGNDYDTVDGTGVRDYLHVSDLALGHVKAVNYVNESAHSGFTAINLGTGTGTSVLQMVNAFERVNNIKVPYIIQARREGDIASAWANPQLAESLLGWKTTRSIDDMCRDGWNWQSKNPEGY
ncbi:UDP-glucose 4-epimerase [Advenella faeciporci]|uniref:UDP-glucose 4-epimerase n=1 Tax=Advenella faeciporci TaxID=797535 RepID=A0A918MYD4_9BURK|nr:UDP-glucose 4-epimerase GalE [Advenella faeciporci]GGW85545.1 UDP-glucose 4-epimerase [Advenella faeciporci]